MNNTLTAYTHLESLLLFQSLHAYGVGNSVFSRISDLLKSNPHITQDKRFQSGRLSPDALRNFYLAILKEELRAEQEGDQPLALNGDGKNSRKRKAPSPNLPSVQESLQHQHLIPKLVNKLYAHYRAQITDQIRQDEDRHDRLSKELLGIERGEWDEHLKETTPVKSPSSRSPSLPRKSPVLHQRPLPSSATPQPTVEETFVPPLASADAPQQHADSPRPGPTQNGQTPPAREGKPVPGASPRKKQAPLDQAHPPSVPRPSQLPVSSPQQARTPQPLAPPTRFPPTQPAAAAYNGPLYAHRSPYPPQTAQPQPPGPQNAQQTGGPHVSNPAHSGPVQSPAVGHGPGPHFQLQPIQPYTGNGVPQYGPPLGPQSQFSPTHQRFPGLHAHGPHSPGVQTSTPPKGYHGIPPFSPQQGPLGQPPTQGGIMLPPFQVSPQDPSRAHQQPVPTPTPAPAPARQHSQASTPVNVRQPPLSADTDSLPPSTLRAAVPPMHPLVTQARHGLSTPTGARTPTSATRTPVSARTVWKRSARNVGTPPPPRPEVEPLYDLESLEQTKQIKGKVLRKTKAKKGKDKDVEKESEPAEETAPETETRQGRARRKAPAKRTRPGSLASSHAGGSLRDRSRSQSILSHTDTVAADNESQTGNRVKSERGTSVDVIEEESIATPTHMSTRRRGGNLQSLPSNKRKRNARELSVEESERRSSTPGLPKVVIAPRHFSRMCNPIMNDIGSHKHASTFTTAVRAKDAEGYYEIIKRPTDLKSIQKAIAAGAKQVTAAASDTPIGSPGGGGGIVELPISLDNIPPKAIVNSAQLEKELMRMFVNAVMFNAGEEGVVEDAREMFETVQQSVSNWRSVERSSGRMEVEETPLLALEDDLPVTSKRRKL